MVSDLKKKMKAIWRRVSFQRERTFQEIWETELRLLNGESLSESTHPSILHVTLNRSASQWVKSVLHQCAVQQGMVHVRWNEMAFNSEYPFLDHLDSVEKYEQIFHPRGYLYSAYGGYPKGIPQVEKYKVVLVIRDPRDILVSRYFSMKESHSVPPETSDKREEFLEDRDFARRVSIDEFVLEKKKNLRNQYDRYLNQLLEEHPDVHVTRYEDMVTDVERWLDRLMAYVDLSPSEDTRTEIIEEARTIQAKDEDPSAHNRKGTPGDHQEKLQPATVKELNDTFSDILDRFGYDQR
ncbi:sulfotransferase domain-containing protein [Salinibacter ruber]|uniref:sulfotransferase domain-containing protein n=1 Tax=Salinibacter ruber TaxID=146919 RepID=UPI002072A48A|nr:sulfotransferase domain-containing protein [Salinibacter ruber]MCS4114595.1 hypothetical protein [Salinibacter ruber]MCS4181772.1 hypothetical protein [Salinibacter ruber]